MKRNPWVDKLDNDTKDSLNKLLVKLIKNRKAYTSSNDPVLAQIWIALSGMQNNQEKLEKRIEKLESFLGVKKKRYSLIPDLEEY